jgi:hypothetical protein
MLSGIARKFTNLAVKQNLSPFPLIFRNFYASKPSTKKASDFSAWWFGTGRDDADKIYIVHRKTNNVNDVKAYLKIAKEDLEMKAATFRIIEGDKTVGEIDHPVADIPINTKSTIAWVFKNLSKLGTSINPTLPESKAWWRDLEPEEIEKLIKMDKTHKGLNRIYNLFNTENDVNAIEEYKRLIRDFDKLNISTEACPVVEVVIPDYPQTSNLPQDIKEPLSTDPLTELV